jgi:hypothetical protein
VENDANGDPHYKHAFNTRVCPPLKVTYANIHLVLSQAYEQLNSWIGRFQSILNQMIPNNFEWYLHALLFIHTQRAIKRQMDKVKDEEDEDDKGIDIEEEE